MIWTAFVLKKREPPRYSVRLVAFVFPTNGPREGGLPPPPPPLPHSNLNLTDPLPQGCIQINICFMWFFIGLFEFSLADLRGMKIKD